MEKVKFIICDDDAEIVKQLTDYIERLCREIGTLYTISSYTDGELFISHYKEKADIIFMDVEMPIMSGMEAAELLRQTDKGVTLVFTTSFEKYAIKGYSVNAYRYKIVAKTHRLDCGMKATFFI